MTPAPDVSASTQDYSEEALRHFLSPGNVGRIDPHDATAFIEHPACGDRLQVWIAMTGRRVESIGFLASGCPGTIAAASAATCLAKGRDVDDALSSVTEEEIDRCLGGLPAGKAHCTRIAAHVVREALLGLPREEAS
jgi:nitrogen fixation NifU-like protein